MSVELPEDQKQRLVDTVREAYMEVFPTATIEDRLDILEPGSYVAVTCSPTKGVDETLQLSARLAKKGFKVVPHIAAKMVRNRSHLREIMARLTDLPIVSIFVPGGDAPRPAGDYTKAVELLRDIAEFDHRLTEIGIASHPEGHPAVSDDILLDEMLKKQEVANYAVTQMCFDAGLIGRWIGDLRARGFTLPIWLGLPSVSDRKTLMTTSLRIGVGNSLRYLKNHGRIAAKLMSSKQYSPDQLLIDLAPFIADDGLNIEGHHIYCFNQVKKAEQWRVGFLDRLTGT